MKRFLPHDTPGRDVCCPAVRSNCKERKSAPDSSGRRAVPSVRYGLLLVTVSAAVLCGCGSSPSRTYLENAISAIDAHSYEDALLSVSQAIETGENKRAAYRLQGLTYLRMAQYENAIASFEEALRLTGGIIEPVDYDINLYLAECYRALSDNATAIEIYNHILALKKKDITALYMRGLTRLETGDIRAATADFDRVLEITPRDFDLRIRMYRAYAENGSEEAGKKVLSDALSRYESAMSDYEKGRIAFYLGNNADAQSYLERAVQSARGAARAEVALFLGLTGEKQGDYGYAISVYSSQIEIDPSFAGIYNRRGICKMAQGNYLSAIADFETGLALNDQSESRSILRNEITAYEYAGDFGRAQSLMQEYLSRYPDDAEAAREEIFLSTR